MKTGIYESDADSLLALDPMPRTEISFRVTETDVLTSDRQSLSDETATRNFGDAKNEFQSHQCFDRRRLRERVNPTLGGIGTKGIHTAASTRGDTGGFSGSVESRAWDIVISDHVLPQFSGPEALKLLRNQGSEIPSSWFPVCSGEEKAATMIKAGANDYILKENFSRLIPALERELKAAHDCRRCKNVERAMQHLAANIHELQKVVAHAVTRCGDKGTLEPEPFGPAENNSGVATATSAPAENGAATDPAGGTGEFPTLGELEKQHIFAALDRCQDQRNAAAALLGINVRTLRNKLHEYNDTSPSPARRHKIRLIQTMAIPESLPWRLTAKPRYRQGEFCEPP